MGVHLTAYGVSDRGAVRTKNQDRFLVSDLAGSATDLDGCEAPPPEADGNAALGPVELSVGAAGVILLVADGMGGHAGGERASALAVETIRSSVPNGAETAPEPFVSSLKDALLVANREIFEEGQSGELRGMGTTATLAGVLGDTVYLAQIGDSRAYLVRDDEMVRLTRDQSLVQDLIDSGVLTEEDARSVPSNQILQALGVSPRLEPALTFHQLRKGDVLLLCSDGLTGVVHDDEILAAVAGAGALDEVGGELVALANQRGGPDNITAVLSRVGGDGLEAPGPRDVLLRRTYPPANGG